MNLYAILRNSNEIKRISLSQEIQNQLTDYINQTVNEIESIDKEKKVEFDGQYKPEDDQILFINKFDDPNRNLYKIDANMLTDEEIDEIKAIVYYFKENKIAYQNFDSRKIIKTNKFSLIYHSDTFSKLENKGIILDNRIDALLLGNVLYFNSFHNATKIFDLSAYFKEATDKELDELRNMPEINFQGINNYELFDSRMRKKIYLIMKNNVVQEVINNYNKVKDYAISIGIRNVFDDNNPKIIFPNDKNKLKDLINFLNDDLYKSVITGKIYETNSKTKKRIDQ